MLYVITQNLIISADFLPSLKDEEDWLLVLTQGLCSVLALRPKNTVVKYLTGSMFFPYVLGEAKGINSPLVPK